MNIRAKIYGGGAAADWTILKAKKPKSTKADALHSIAVSREARRLANSRDEDRHRLSNERVRVSHNGTDHDAELINLSGGGAMIAGPFRPMLWDRVELHLGQHGTVECVVRWLRDDRIGLEFAHETRLDCPANEIAAVLPAVITRSFPDVEFRPLNGSTPDLPAEHTGDEFRTVPRHPLIWSGVLHHDYQSTPVRIRTISRTGAMIESSAPVRVGAQPLLELSDAASLSATVEWVVGDQAGLSFDAPFDMNLRAESRPSVAPSNWSPPAYLEVPAGDHGDSPPEDRWGRPTAPELRRELERFLKR